MLQKEFMYNDQKLRALVDDKSNVWFVVNDVSKILGYTNPFDLVKLLPKSEMKLYPVEYEYNGYHNMSIIGDKALYDHIKNDSNENTINFSKWLIETVIPEMNKLIGKNNNPSKENIGMLQKEFMYNDQKLRVLVDNKSNVWFVAADVMKILDIKNRNNLLKRFLEKDKKLYPVEIVSDVTYQNLTIINGISLIYIYRTSYNRCVIDFIRWLFMNVFPIVMKETIPDSTESEESKDTETTNLYHFTYNGYDLRVFSINGLWYSVQDVFKILKCTNYCVISKALSSDDIHYCTSCQNPKEISVINYNALERLATLCNNKNAEEFMDWIKHKVNKKFEDILFDQKEDAKYLTVMNYIELPYFNNQKILKAYITNTHAVYLPIDDICNLTGLNIDTIIKYRGLHNPDYKYAVTKTDEGKYIELIFITDLFQLLDDLNTIELNLFKDFLHLTVLPKLFNINNDGKSYYAIKLTNRLPIAYAKFNEGLNNDIKSTTETVIDEAIDSLKRISKAIKESN